MTLMCPKSGGGLSTPRSAKLGPPTKTDRAVPVPVAHPKFIPEEKNSYKARTIRPLPESGRRVFIKWLLEEKFTSVKEKECQLERKQYPFHQTIRPKNWPHLSFCTSYDYLHNFEHKRLRYFK